MKKVLPVLLLTLLVWGCNKKMTPAKTEVPPSNTGTSNSNIGSTNTNTTPSTQPTVTPMESKSPTSLAPLDVSKLSPADQAAVAGQIIFNAKCNRCHSYKVVSDYTVDRWTSILQVMAMKANLTEAEKANVLAYVTANAKK